MQQLEFFDIPSPCIGVCQAGPKGYCIGCYRSRDERLHWVKLESDVKRKIIKACHNRRRRAEAASKSIDSDEQAAQITMWDDLEN